MTTTPLAIRFVVSVCATWAFAVTPPIATTDWPAFGGPEHNGVSEARDVPVQWSADHNVAWKQPILGSGWSSPCLVDGKIYLTTATGSAETEDVSLRVLRVNAADGHIEWDVEAIRPDADTAGIMHSKNSLASATPVVDQGRIYAHFGHMGTAALDLEGNVLWRQTELGYNPMHGNGGSPTVVGQLLVYSADGNDSQHVIALDRATGQLAWRTPRSDSQARQGFSFSTPSVIDVGGQRQVVSAGSGYVAAYEPSDGREIWRVKYGDGYSVVPRPIWAHQRVYVCSGFMRASLLAIDPRGASGDVTQSHVVWQHDEGVPNTPTPLVFGDEVYFVSDRGVASCLHAHTGQEHWKERLGGGFSASPVAAGGRLYFVSEDGTTHVVRAHTTFELLAKNELGERVLASPAVDDGTIYIRGETHLWRIGAPE